MLGMHVAGAYPAPLRWVYRVFGFLNIHDRQRWAILWPLLRERRGRGTRVLDVGCGSGRWVLELAARMPDWTVVGIDRNAELIQRADERRAQLGIGNARFLAANGLEYVADDRFDVVLSVNSAHYAVPTGNGLQMFRRFREWLEPSSGVLILLAPWCVSGKTAGRDGQNSPGFVSTSQIAEMCEASALRVDLLRPCIGRLGILAKKLALVSERAAVLAAALYPLELALSFLDRRLGADRGRSAAVLLRARPLQRTAAAGKERRRFEDSPEMPLSR
jgi:SAM-dependent methyltransferase